MNTADALILDRNVPVLERWDTRIRQALRPLVTEELIAEHERDPLGYHSDALNRVLNYFRRTTSKDGKYLVVCTEPFRRWHIARLSGVRGRAPVYVDERNFESEREA